MKRSSAILLASSLLALSGCAAIQGQQAADSEEILAEAGFHKTHITELKTVPVRQLFERGESADRWFEFVDPDYCHCSYVGYDKNLAVLTELRTARLQAHERAVKGIGITSGGSDSRAWGAWDPQGLDVK